MFFTVLAMPTPAGAPEYLALERSRLRGTTSNWLAVKAGREAAGTAGDGGLSPACRAREEGEPAGARGPSGSAVLVMSGVVQVARLGRRGWATLEAGQ
jgi:hypothetical protein